MVGATRGGLAPAKEGVGKNPERYKLVEPGTIFYNPMRILLGSIAFLDEGEPPGITSPDYVVFRTRSGMVHPRWFYYWLRSEDGGTFIRTLARGAVRERVLFRRLAEAEIEVAAYDSQIKFARAIGFVERARAAAEVQIEEAASVSAAYLRKVFDSAEAQSWERKWIRDIAECCSGATPARHRFEYFGGTIPWVKTGELKDDLIERTEEYVTEAAVRETSLRLLPAGTLLVAMYGQGQTRGRTGLLAVPATTNQACFAILPNPSQFDPAYLQLWFRYSYLRIRGHSEGRGGNQPNLSGGLLGSEEVPLPSIEQQRRVVDVVKTGIGAGELLRKAVSQEIEGIGALPGALLRRAFSGEL